MDLHWIAGAPPATATRLTAKTRYRMPAAPCVLESTPSGMRGVFATPQWAPTPGQYLVFYDGDVCLGGGVIAARADAGNDVVIEAGERVA